MSQDNPPPPRHRHRLQLNDELAAKLAALSTQQLDVAATPQQLPTQVVSLTSREWQIVVVSLRKESQWSGWVADQICDQLEEHAPTSQVPRTIRGILHAVATAAEQHEDAHLADVRVLMNQLPIPHYVLCVRVYISSLSRSGSAVNNIPVVPVRDETVETIVDETIKQAVEAGRFGDGGPWPE